MSATDKRSDGSAVPRAAGEDWLEILRREAEQRTITVVAFELGYSRTALSLVLNGKYPASTARLEAAVLNHFVHSVPCPFLERTLARDLCIKNARAPMPTSSPQALRFWKSCQACAFHPDKPVRAGTNPNPLSRAARSRQNRKEKSRC